MEGGGESEAANWQHPVDGEGERGEGGREEGGREGGREVGREGGRERWR